MSNSSSPAPPSSQAQKKRKSSHSSPTSNKAQQNALNTSNGATSPRSSNRRGSRTDADISPSSGSRSSKSPAAQIPFDFFGSNPSLSGYSFNSLPSLPSMGLLGGEKEKGLHPQQGPEVSHRDVTVTSTTSHPSGMGGSTDNGRLLPSDAPQGNGSRSPTMGSPPSPPSGLPTGLPQARPGASNTPSAGPMPPQSQTQTQPQPPLSQPQPQQQPPPQSQTQPQPSLPTGAPSSPQGAAAVSSPPQSSSGGSPGMNALVAQNNNRRIINPVTVPNGQNFVDITEYLNMPQSEAAKKLSIPPSTLSKRWKEAVRNRKWPWRVVCKLDKEIMTLLHNVPQGAPIPEEIEGRLGYLMRKRQDELKPVVIRL